MSDSGRVLTPTIKTLTYDGEVRPHFAQTIWGVLVWPDDPALQRVDEYTSREKAEGMLRTCYGKQAVLVRREITAWQVPDA